MQGVARAVHARALAVPHGEDAIDVAVGAHAGLLRPHDGGGRHVFVDAGKEGDLAGVQRLLRLPHRHVDAAQGRPAIARHETGRVQAAFAVHPGLREHDAHERLRPGQDDAAGLPREVVGKLVLKVQLGFGGGSAVHRDKAMDKTDIGILKALQEDGRASAQQLSEKVGLSAAPRTGGPQQGGAGMHVRADQPGAAFLQYGRELRTLGARCPRNPGVLCGHGRFGLPLEDPGGKPRGLRPVPAPVPLQHAGHPPDAHHRGATRDQARTAPAAVMRIAPSIYRGRNVRSGKSAVAVVYWGWMPEMRIHSFQRAVSSFTKASKRATSIDSGVRPKARSFFAVASSLTAACM
ncbi:hypothetical protein G6F65_015566 [Rhizopus arrhizus]|nr:hypothetical protein G6F65_015566 [Rhizopus arrhizus]